MSLLRLELKIAQTSAEGRNALRLGAAIDGAGARFAGVANALDRSRSARLDAGTMARRPRIARLSRDESENPMIPSQTLSFRPGRASPAPVRCELKLPT